MDVLSEGVADTGSEAICLTLPCMPVYLLVNLHLLLVVLSKDSK